MASRTHSTEQIHDSSPLIVTHHIRTETEWAKKVFLTSNIRSESNRQRGTRKQFHTRRKSAESIDPFSFSLFPISPLSYVSIWRRRCFQWDVRHDWKSLRISPAKSNDAGINFTYRWSRECSHEAIRSAWEMQEGKNAAIRYQFVEMYERLSLDYSLFRENPSEKHEFVWLWIDGWRQVIASLSRSFAEWFTARNVFNTHISVDAQILDGWSPDNERRKRTLMACSQDAYRRQQFGRQEEGERDVLLSQVKFD